MRLGARSVVMRGVTRPCYARAGVRWHLGDDRAAAEPACLLTLRPAGVRTRTLDRRGLLYSIPQPVYSALPAWSSDLLVQHTMFCTRRLGALAVGRVSARRGGRLPVSQRQAALRTGRWRRSCNLADLTRPWSSWPRWTPRAKRS